MKFNRSIFLMFFALVMSGILCPQEAAPQGRIFVTALPTDTVTVAPGHSASVKFVFRVQTGYHVNSNKPLAPELIPTQLHFSLPGEVAVGKVQYPAGELMSFPFDPANKLSVYSGDFSVRGAVVAPTAASTGTYTIHGELRYQACDNNSCYPPKKLPFTFNVKIGSGGKALPKARPGPMSPHIHN